MSRKLDIFRIDVYSVHDDNYQEELRFKGTYAHGEIETELDYDIFSFSRNPNIDGPGEYEFIINDKIATFFLWESEIDMRSKWRGLIVYNTDKEYSWAKEKYNKKTDVL
jgi:hypothetical protein